MIAFKFTVKHPKQAELRLPIVGPQFNSMHLKKQVSKSQTVVNFAEQVARPTLRGT